ncbi:hypothetical protein C3L33_16738, partial [Rhododendron williamsianum]
MGSSAEALQSATKVYRHLLKAVKKHVGKEDHKSHFVDFISQEFRKSPQQSDLSAIRQKIKLANDYTYLLNSVHHHQDPFIRAKAIGKSLFLTWSRASFHFKDLLFSYNIAVDRSEEMKKVLGKSAASVGLQLPEAYQP